MPRYVDLEKLPPMRVMTAGEEVFVDIRDIRQALLQAEADTRIAPPRGCDALVCLAVRSDPWQFVGMLNNIAHGIMLDPNEDIRPLIAEAACVIANLLLQTDGVILDVRRMEHDD